MATLTEAKKWVAEGTFDRLRAIEGPMMSGVQLPDASPEMNHFFTVLAWSGGPFEEPEDEREMLQMTHMALTRSGGVGVDPVLYRLALSHVLERLGVPDGALQQLNALPAKAVPHLQARLRAIYRSMSTFPKVPTFRERVEEFWARWKEDSGYLRGLDADYADEQFMAEMRDLCLNIFADPRFTIGRTGKKLEVILPTYQSQARVHALLYIKERMPKSLQRYWQLTIGRDGISKYDGDKSYLYQGTRYVFSRIRVAVNTLPSGHYALLFDRKTFPLEMSDAECQWLAKDLVSYQLSELAFIALFKAEVVIVPEKTLTKETSFPLTQLEAELKARGCDLAPTPESIANTMTVYQQQRCVSVSGTPKNMWRSSPHMGMTVARDLPLNYAKGDTYDMAMLLADGIVAGFLILPWGVPQEAVKKLEEFLHTIPEIVKSVGGTGTPGDHLYLDVMIWDWPLFVEKMTAYCAKESAFPWVKFFPMRNQAGIEATILKEDRKTAVRR